MAVSFGGGQQHPANLSHPPHINAVLQQLREDPAIQEVARRVDYLLKCYFPKLHRLYTNVLDDLCQENPSLTPNFPKCCFAASSFNFKHAVTFPHYDSLNLLFGQCAVFNCGTFDYKKGGHLVLWDLKLIIEFPPGCVILLPSALLRHSNTAISPHEIRHSLTFFSASGLFRWRHNNSMSDKDFLTAARPEVRAAWRRYKEDLWRTGLDFLND
ncbi:hypothetical protein K435DRAFT_819262 [Dendrothele bispora CBS 962.96]|uniref:Prolyl 4-hydroxylase alpha subunit Fe(2+) 2OG dioxygenase domain-containing protein n=1 Tax=Dendrothele bispora (strain CBS 962.96) TaxID=1314807 RepID=A0A4S8M4P5_DENBC|nr:hypothetical protein K435DRAFT_819262 [Dendrothele bispora CBS 962.96]